MIKPRRNANRDGGPEVSRATILRRLAVLAFVALLIAPGCSGSSNKTGYLSDDADSTVFISWTESGSGNLAGSVQAFGRSSIGSTETDTYSASLSGVRQGSRIALTIDFGLGIKQTWSGTFQKSTLTLQLPQDNGTLSPRTFHPAVVDAYNSTVESISRTLKDQSDKVAQAKADSDDLNRQKAVVAQAAETLASDITALRNMIQGLADGPGFQDSLAAYAQAWSDEQTAYDHEKEDLGDSSKMCSKVEIDAGLVETKQGLVEVAKGKFDSDAGTLNRSLAQLRDALSKIQPDFDWLQRAIGFNPRGRVDGPANQADVDHITTDASHADTSARATISSAEAQASQYDSDALALREQAVALAHSGRCRS